MKSDEDQSNLEQHRRFSYNGRLLAILWATSSLGESLMKSIIHVFGRLLAASACLTLFLSAASAEDSGNSAVGVEVKPLLKANQTMTGGPLVYPTGNPEISAAITTIQPGGHTILHTHPVVTFIYVMEGEFDVHENGKVHAYKAGEALIEPIDIPNQVFNPGKSVTKVLVVFAGSEGNPNGSPVK